MKKIIFPILILLSICILCSCGEEKVPQTPQTGNEPLAEPSPGNYLFDFYNDDSMNAFAENFYTDTPVALEYFKANIVQCTIDDPEIIEQVFKSLKKVQIGDEMNISVTDSEIHFVFIMADQRRFAVCFETQNMLTYGGKNYQVIDSGDLFSIDLPTEE